MKKTFQTIGILLSLALLLAACGGGENPLADTSWTLDSYGPQGDLQTIPPDINATADFDEAGTGISGSAGCNLFSGEVTVNGDKISAGMISWTEMACFPEEIMDVESEYMRILGQVERFEIQDGQLTLYAGDGQILVFKQQ